MQSDQDQLLYMQLMQRQTEAAELANLIAMASNPIIFNRISMEQQEHILDEIEKRTVDVVGMAVKQNYTEEESKINSIGLG